MISTKNFHPDTDRKLLCTLVSTFGTDEHPYISSTAAIISGLISSSKYAGAADVVRPARRLSG